MDRRASFISLFLGSLVSLSAIVSTGACGSVPDLRFDDGDAGNISAGEGGVDARRDVDPNCKKTGPEICDDGIDNDCNGDVDCQDSACGGFSCQDAPAGWTAVGFAAAERPSCPSGESESDLKVVSGDGSATCACSCNAVGGSCATNDFALKLTTENTCGVAPTMANIPPSAANCTDEYSLSISDGQTVTEPFRFGGQGQGQGYSVTVRRGERTIGTKNVPLDSTCGWSYQSKPGVGAVSYEVRPMGDASAASLSSVKITVNQ